MPRLIVFTASLILTSLLLAGLAQPAEAQSAQPSYNFAQSGTSLSLTVINSGSNRIQADNGSWNYAVVNSRNVDCTQAGFASQTKQSVSVTAGRSSQVVTVSLSRQNRSKYYCFEILYGSSASQVSKLYVTYRPDFDVEGPAGVVAVSRSGTYSVGDQIIVSVTFDEPVKLSPGGSGVKPSLGLRFSDNKGQRAAVLDTTRAQTLSNNLRFVYTVGIGDYATDLNNGSEIILDSSASWTIIDRAGNTKQTFGLPTSGSGSLAQSANLVVDARPSLTVSQQASRLTASSNIPSATYEYRTVTSKSACKQGLDFTGSNVRQGKIANLSDDDNNKIYCFKASDGTYEAFAAHQFQIVVALPAIRIIDDDIDEGYLRISATHSGKDVSDRVDYVHLPFTDTTCGEIDFREPEKIREVSNGRIDLASVSTYYCLRSKGFGTQYAYAGLKVPILTEEEEEIEDEEAENQLRPLIRVDQVGESLEISVTDSDGVQADSLVYIVLDSSQTSCDNSDFSGRSAIAINNNELQLNEELVGAYLCLRATDQTDTDGFKVFRVRPIVDQEETGTDDTQSGEQSAEQDDEEQGDKGSSDNSVFVYVVLFAVLIVLVVIIVIISRAQKKLKL